VRVDRRRKGDEIEHWLFVVNYDEKASCTDNE